MIETQQTTRRTMQRASGRSGRATTTARALIMALALAMMWGGALWVVSVVSVPSEALADYEMPTTQAVFGGERALSVIDAQVLGFDAEGKARLRVHGALLGESAPERALEGVVYTCFGGTWANFGVKGGQRYVIFLLGDSMLEEQSYFPVQERDGITYVVVSAHYVRWLGLDAALSAKGVAAEVKVEALRERVQALAEEARARR